MMRILEEENVHGMQLVQGRGNGEGREEPDRINTVYVMDLEQFPFYQAEVYHQFHNGIGLDFGPDYTQSRKAEALQRGVIAGTGCPDVL